MKTTKLIFLTALMFGSLIAKAEDLESARAAKTVVELPSGYVESRDPKTKALAEEVNAKRKAAYTEIAKKNNLPIDQVGAQAAKKIEEKLKGK